ncbi:MAG: hypothetical protein WA624_13985, partial [Methylocella sp.]
WINPVRVKVGANRIASATASAAQLEDHNVRLSKKPHFSTASVKLRLSGHSGARQAYHRKQTSINRRQKCCQYPTLKPIEVLAGGDSRRGCSLPSLGESFPRIAFQESELMPNVVDSKVVCL